MDGRRECEPNCVCQAREFVDIANDCICDDCEHKQKGLCLEGFGQADNNFTDNDNNGYAIIKTIIAEPVAGKGVGAASKINGVNNAQRARSRYCY